MVENNVEYGLGVLRYLGIGEFAEEERDTFRKEWDKVYKQNDCDIICTTDILYTSLKHKIEGSLDFMDMLDASNLKLRLGSGESIEDILGKYFRGA